MLKLLLVTIAALAALREASAQTQGSYSLGDARAARAVDAGEGESAAETVAPIGLVDHDDVVRNLFGDPTADCAVVASFGHFKLLAVHMACPVTCWGRNPNFDDSSRTAADYTVDQDANVAAVFGFACTRQPFAPAGADSATCTGQPFVAMACPVACVAPPAPLDVCKCKQDWMYGTESFEGCALVATGYDGADGASTWCIVEEPCIGSAYNDAETDYKSCNTNTCVCEEEWEYGTTFQGCSGTGAKDVWCMTTEACKGSTLWNGFAGDTRHYVYCQYLLDAAAAKAAAEAKVAAAKAAAEAKAEAAYNRFTDPERPRQQSKLAIAAIPIFLIVFLMVSRWG